MSSPHGLHFEYASGCLMIRVTGRGLIEQKDAAIQEIADAIDAQPVNAVLVDMRELLPPYTFMDRYQLGELAAKHLSKVPLGLISLEKQIDKQRIGQLVAINRGAKMEIFTDPIAAREWLKQFARS